MLDTYKDLSSKLDAELPGIFAFALGGMQAYLENSLNPPPEVLHATKEYELESDTLGEFLEDCCISNCNDADLVTPSAKPYKAFCNHCEQAGYKPQDVPHFLRFGKMLMERDFRPFQTTKHRCRLGSALKPTTVVNVADPEDQKLAPDGSMPLVDEDLASKL